MRARSFHASWRSTLSTSSIRSSSGNPSRSACRRVRFSVRRKPSVSVRTACATHRARSLRACSPPLLAGCVAASNASHVAGDGVRPRPQRALPGEGRHPLPHGLGDLGEHVARVCLAPVNRNQEPQQLRPVATHRDRGGAVEVSPGAERPGTRLEPARAASSTEASVPPATPRPESPRRERRERLVHARRVHQARRHREARLEARLGLDRLRLGSGHRDS